MVKPTVKYYLDLIDQSSQYTSYIHTQTFCHILEEICGAKPTEGERRLF